MANIVASFTPVRAWRHGGPNNKALIITEGTLVVTGAGGTNAGEIPALLFGLTQFIGPGCFTLSDNTKLYRSVPEYTTATSTIISADNAGAAGDLPIGTYKAYVQGFST